MENLGPPQPPRRHPVVSTKPLSVPQPPRRHPVVSTKHSTQDGALQPPQRPIRRSDVSTKHSTQDGALGGLQPPRRHPVVSTKPLSVPQPPRRHSSSTEPSPENAAMEVSDVGPRGELPVAPIRTEKLENAAMEVSDVGPGGKLPVAPTRTEKSEKVVKAAKDELLNTGVDSEAVKNVDKNISALDTLMGGEEHTVESYQELVGFLDDFAKKIRAIWRANPKSKAAWVHYLNTKGFVHVSFSDLQRANTIFFNKPSNPVPSPKPSDSQSPDILLPEGPKSKHPPFPPEASEGGSQPTVGKAYLDAAHRAHLPLGKIPIG